MQESYAATAEQRAYTTAPLLAPQQKAADGTATYTFRMTSDVVDRQGEIVTLDGWDFTDYMANPVVLDTHQYQSIAAIVGRCTGITRDADGWNADVVFNSTPNGTLAAALVEAGDLRAVSVGFRPLVCEYPDLASLRTARAIDDETIKRLVTMVPDPASAIRHTVKQLLEVSVVPIPANPQAVRIRSYPLETETTNSETDDASDMMASSGHDDPTVWYAVANAMVAVLHSTRLHDPTRRRLYGTLERAYRALKRTPPELLTVQAIASLTKEAANGVWWHDEPKIVSRMATSTNSARRKQGRVLSSMNEALITQAVALLSQVLVQMEQDEGDLPEGGEMPPEPMTAPPNYQGTAELRAWLERTVR